MSNMPGPVRLVPMQETPTVSMQDMALPEVIEPSPVAAAEMSGSVLGKLAAYAGELVTTDLGKGK